MSTAASERRPLTAPTVFFLVAVAGLCWAVTVDRMRGMNMGPGMDLGGLGWFAAVWLTMMAAMMLPSLTPMAVASSRGCWGTAQRDRQKRGVRRRVSTGVARVRRARVRARSRSALAR